MDKVLDSYIGNKFIRNYERKDDNIILYLHDNYSHFLSFYFKKGKPKLRGIKEEVIPYTEENEKYILDKMRKQNNNYETNFSNLKTKGIISTICSSLQLMVLMYAILSATSLLSFLIGLPVNLLFTSSMFLALFTEIKKISDIKKLQLFIENEDKINESIKNDVRTLTGVSPNLLSSVAKVDNDKDYLKINDLKNCSLKDINKILKNIKKLEANENNQSLDNSLGSKIKRFFNHNKDDISTMDNTLEDADKFIDFLKKQDKRNKIFTIINFVFALLMAPFTIVHPLCLLFCLTSVTHGVTSYINLKNTKMKLKIMQYIRGNLVEMENKKANKQEEDEQPHYIDLSSNLESTDELHSSSIQKPRELVLTKRDKVYIK